MRYLENRKLPNIHISFDVWNNKTILKSVCLLSPPQNLAKWAYRFLGSNPSVAHVRTQPWTRRFVHVCRFECIYWTIWGRASKPRGDNFARRVAQLSASAKYVTLMVIIPLSLRLTVTSVTRNIALIPWCAQPLCDTYKCLTQMAQMRAARVRLARSARRILEGYLNALVNAFGLFDQTNSSGTFIKRRIFH